MHLITGYAGTAHITSANDGQVNAHIFGSGSYVFDSRLKFRADIESNTSIKINSGEGLFNGRYFEIATGSYDTATLENGTIGTNRIDLITARYQKDAESGVETMTVNVIKGEAGSSPVAPTYYSGSILDGVGIADFPLYKITIEGLTIKKVEALFTVRKDIVTDVQESNSSTVTAIDELIKNSGQYEIVDIGISQNTAESDITTYIDYLVNDTLSDYDYISFGVRTSALDNYYISSGIISTEYFLSEMSFGVDRKHVVSIPSTYVGSSSTTSTTFGIAVMDIKLQSANIVRCSTNSNEIYMSGTYDSSTSKTTINSTTARTSTSKTNIGRITHIYGYKKIAQE